MNLSETRGGDDKIVLEFRLEMAKQTNTEATALVTLIETHSDGLSV